MQPEHPIEYFSHLKMAVLSFAIALIVWAAFTWPLPLYMNEGIPCSTQNVEKDHVRYMISGDHLQLMYHFQLMKGFVSGEIPWFHNLYEFNAGDDAATKRVRAYFFPFSLVFALVSGFTNDAFAWNICGLISIWLSLWFTAKLIRLFVNHPWIPFLTAAIAVCLPWRWVSLMGGSPMGFAMCWVPAFWVGITWLVRDHSWRGGVLAGLASLFISFGDFQTYYFSLLSLPAWLFLIMIRFDCIRQWKSAIKPGLPCAALLGLGMGHALLAMKAHTSTSISGGRDLDEVTRSSPVWQNFFTWQGSGLEAHSFLGYTLVLFSLGALLLILLRLQGRERLFAMGLFAGICGVIALGLGMNGPFDGHLITGVRKVFPYYDRVRQPLKIWCLLPPLLALFTALGRRALMQTAHERGGKRRPLLLGMMGLIITMIVIENKLQIRPTICLLEHDNAAYAAIAESSERPRAMAIPLWPGDSDWSSLYEYYGMRYGVRMLNGYSPVVSLKYMEEVYTPLRGVNQGILAPKDVTWLLSKGIDHVVLHENAFPENVSPWPVDATLERLMANPQLVPIKQDGPVHAFKLAAASIKRPELEPLLHFPAPRYEGEGIPAYGGRVEIIQDSTASGGRALLALEEGITMESRARLMLGDTHGWYRYKATRQSSWMWKRFESDHPEPGFASWSTELAKGEVIDYVFFGDTISELPRLMPASSFFHGGYSTPPAGEVFLRPRYDHAGEILYGYLIPEKPGIHRLIIHYTSPDAPLNAPLGTITCVPNVLPQTTLMNQTGLARMQVFLNFKDTRPTKFAFHYFGTYPVTLKQIELQ